MVYLLTFTIRNQPFMWVNTVDGRIFLHHLLFNINRMKNGIFSPSQLVGAGFLPLVEAPGGGSTGAAGAAGGRSRNGRRKMANGSVSGANSSGKEPLEEKTSLWRDFFLGVLLMVQKSQTTNHLG